MGLLSKLFGIYTADEKNDSISKERYNYIIEKTKIILKNYNSHWPLSEVFCYDELVNNCNGISPDDIEYYPRARFLLELLQGIASIQRMVSQVQLQDYALSLRQMSKDKPLSEEDFFIKYYYTPNSGIENIIATAIGGAVAILVIDQDADIRVAQDLGSGNDYPTSQRLPLPLGVDKNEKFYEIGSQRVLLFWKTVLKFPVHPSVEIMAGYKGGEAYFVSSQKPSDETKEDKPPPIKLVVPKGL